MIREFRGKWRLPMSLCGISLSLAVLYLCTYKALGQIPPNDYGPNQVTVEFSASSYTVNEGDTATITVTWGGTWGPNQPITVNYATSDGTGHAGTDYTPASGTFQAPSDLSAQTFNVATINNPNNTSYVTVNLTLSSPYNCTLGSPATATLYIVNPAACSSN